MINSCGVKKQQYIDQPSMFDIFYIENNVKSKTIVDFGMQEVMPESFCFDKYTVQKYIDDIGKYGLNKVWSAILDYALTNNSSELLSIQNFGVLYEIGLAEQDKTNKKESGQYFTPDDVSSVMANWLKNLKGNNICDVGCGTGNLILAYLKQVGTNDAERLLSERKIYLYDNDSLALQIAQYSIALTYGKEYLNSINLIYGDFLDKAVVLPKDAKVISNPPYAKITQIKPTWQKTENLLSSKDYYSAFIEKIVTSGCQAVVISPYSFLGGNKYYSLRKVLNDYNGFIVSFDNVPGNIFNGKKHGIFNTNTANSVRAAITVIENTDDSRGFRTSHLVRFKTEERENLLNNDILESLLSENKQIVSQGQPSYVKCHKELDNLFRIWTNKSNKQLLDQLSKKENEFALYVPNTCRYFTTASVTKLSRTGMITLYAKDEESYDFLYCLINSSFAYWHWRIFDGGITYPVGLLNSIPVFVDLLLKEDKDFFSNMRKKMANLEKQYIVTKLNAGVEQENIKFPKSFREEINSKFFKVLGCNDNPQLFDLVHSNAVFNTVIFNINSVRQLNPTIAGKVFFKGLKYLDIKNYYV